MHNDDDQLTVSFWTGVFESFVHSAAGFWVWLAGLETSYLEDALELVPCDRPIYISGLARSGTTILLELLAKHSQVGTHQYRDFPPIYTPVWWNWLLDRMPKAESIPMERSHKDGIQITPDSPEAMEEVLWMRFFQGCHDPRQSNVLNGNTENVAFEQFYREHIRKILLLRGSSRYVAKGNYNISRASYLLKMLPDARMIFPIRKPLAHIASLMKQHRLFCELETRNKRILSHMQRMGHYEFGLDRRPINFGDKGEALEIVELWNKGEEVRGWARYWSSAYRFIGRLLRENHALGRASLIVRYEELCQDPEKSLNCIFDHCQLEIDQGILNDLAGRLHYPTYYKPSFSETDIGIIIEETQAVAESFDLLVTSQ